jgi:Ser/Thr protein kinase RdoA (MazF antagonist)
MEDLFKQRINYSGDLKDISIQICKDYNLGNFKSNKLILVGYEDFNFVLETSEGKFFTKIFANFRSLDDCKRYIEIMEKAIKSNISTPRLYNSNQGFLYIKEINRTELRLCVAEFIQGKTFFELNKKPNEKEVKFLANQAALISSIDYNPPFIYDSWAITSFLKEYKEKSKKLSEEDLSLINPLVKEFKDIEIKKLPHCFVHGDIITTNVIKDNKNKLLIIDFSCSNYAPRIQELAVLTCDMLFDKNREISQKNLEIALKEYQKIIPLTEKELKALPIYIRLAHAMHVLRAGYEKVVNKNNTPENEHFLVSGRMGLEQTL